jgi:N6-adenosine-specific RNA methylase IME4
MNDWFFSPLTPCSYEMIVCDPSIRFDAYSQAGEKKSAQHHYRTMSDDETLALPIRSLAAHNCLLYLWATAPKLPLALKMVEHWGFSYKSVMMWRKTTRHGKVRLGTGFRVRSTGEIVIVATLGNPKQAFVPRTIFDGLAREHSRKPDEFYAICERVMPQARRADIFARQRRPGWDSFGDQLEHFDDLSLRVPTHDGERQVQDREGGGAADAEAIGAGHAVAALAGKGSRARLGKGTGAGENPS